MKQLQCLKIVAGLVAALAACGVALAQGQVVGWGKVGWNGSWAPSQPPLGNLLPYKQVAAGDSHTVALKNDGTVVAWGWNDYGQTSVPPNLTGVTQVAAGFAHTVALKNDGTVVAWGEDFSGQTSVPSNLTGVTQVAAGYAHTVVLKNDGTVVAWGDNEDGQTSVPTNLTGVTQVVAGGEHTVALKNDGTVVAWGAGTTNTGNYPNFGQSIVPANLTGVTQVAAGAYHTVALKNDGTVVAWGAGTTNTGNTGNSPNFGQSIVPANLTGVTQVAAGAYHTVALKNDGTVVPWGTDWPGLSVPANLTGVTQIAAGNSHTVVLKNNGTVVAWGDNSFGQTSVPTDLTGVSQVAAGGGRTVVLKNDGTVVTWGIALYGLIDEPTNLTGVTQVAAGGGHTVALKNDGTVVAWGAGMTNTGDPDYGQSIVPANLTGVTQVAAGAYHTVTLKNDGTVVAWGAGITNTGDPDYGQSIVPANLTGVTQVAAGGWHTVALKNDGSVVAWGSNIAGQTSVPTNLTGVIQVAAGGYHTVVLKNDGRVVAWGLTTSVPANATGVTQVVAGLFHTVALKNDGTVVAWSTNNEAGQTDVPTNLTGVTQVAAGYYQTVALLNPALSSCSNPGGAGVATLARSGVAWQAVGAWSWSGGGGPQVPGSLTNADLGTYGSVGSDCSAAASTLTTRSGTTLLVTAAASAAGNEHSIRVGGTANLAGRLWLLGVSGAGSTLPENLDLPVLSAGTVNGNFDLLQSELPPPPGFFLTLVPEDVNGRTVFSLRLLPLPGGGELAPGGLPGTFSGKAVAAETIDINHDGFDDLALAVDLGPTQPGRIQILLNDGAGGLGTTMSVLEETPAQPTCLAVGDVDGDGNEDVVVGLASDLSARVYRDDGQGGLTPGEVISGVGGTPTSVVVLPPGGSSLRPGGASVGVGISGNKLKIYFNTALQQEITLAGVPSTVRGGNTGGTQGTDIVTGGSKSASINMLPAAETGFVQVLRRELSGLYAIQQTMLLTAKPVAMDVADLDGDGLDDIVTANSDPVLPAAGSALPVLSIFRNSGGTFGGGVPYQPTNASSGLDVSLIDVDNDGDRDIVSVYKRVGTDSEAALLRMDTLGAGTPISIGQTTVLDASDPILSARGNLDGSGGEDLFLVNQPSGSFLTGTQEVKPFLATGGLKQGDLDGDGTVGSSDIGILLLDFGPCSGCPSDLDGSGEVDAGDLSFLLLLFD